jgi:hypothetical protein
MLLNVHRKKRLTVLTFNVKSDLIAWVSNISPLPFLAFPIIREMVNQIVTVH